MFLMAVKYKFLGVLLHTMKVCVDFRKRLRLGTNNLNNTCTYHAIAVVELGVVIGKRGRDIKQSQADSHVAGYGAQCFL